MWEQYEPPGEKESSPPTPSARSYAPIHAGGQHHGPRVLAGIVAFLACVGISLGIASSSEDAVPEPDYSGFYECVAEEEAGEPGILSPADLCDIDNERPPDYVDDHEYDPLGGYREDSGGYGEDSGGYGEDSGGYGEDSGGYGEDSGGYGSGY